MQKIKYYLFKFLKNKSKISINSIKASYKANYGKNTLICANTYIADDVTIGRFTYINENCSVENTIIGNFCSIAANVYINPFEHPYYFISTHPFLFNKFYGIIDEEVNIKRKKVCIGNDVWIGLNAVILQGCKIGNGAIIAAGAIVTHDVPAYEIWGGIPAKKIGARFTDEQKKIIESSEWWNWSEDKLRSKCKDMYEYRSFEKIL